jgi:hypothetical protein
MSHARNEWWLEDSELHIGDTIILEDDGITIPSFRHSYETINDLKLFTHEEYCIVYSTSYPMLDIWKYKVGNGTVAGTTYTKTLKMPAMDLYHAERIVSRPYTPVEIEYRNNSFIISWSHDHHQSTFDISSECFTNEAFPAKKASDFKIENEIIIHSPCGKYYIKHSKEVREGVYIFNSQDDFLFDLKHNTYQSHYCCNIIEFVADKIVINDQHASLGIYDLSGQWCHRIYGDDEFYTQKFRVKDDDGKEYLVLYGFIWAPVYFMSIYDIEQMVADKSYEPDQYWERDTAGLGNADEDVDVGVAGNKVCHGMTPSVFKEFMIQKKENEKIAKRELLNKRWNEDNMLKAILVSHPIDETIKSKILSAKECPRITCFGGNSGSEFEEHAENIVLKPVAKSIVDFIAGMIVGDYYSKKNSIYLKEVNLIFTVDCILRIHIIIPMTKITDKDSYLFPENDEQVSISFS